MSPVPVDVQHDKTLARFVIRQDGAEAYLSYRRAGGEIDFFSTFVPEELRGRGLAEHLCKAAFAYAQSEKLQVIPSCSYIAGAYLKRHPEYLALVKR